MVIIEHYLRLFTSLPEIKVGENREISISQVSEILFCTDRNTRLILKSFEEENWIEWIPGKGRGNLSTIGFLVGPSNLVLRQAREFVKKGNIREAKKIIEDYTPQYTFLKSEFSRWFNTFFWIS